MKWIIRAIGILLLILVVAVGSLFLLPADRIARIAADQLRNLTGREVTITGDVGLTFWPVLGVTAGGLEVGNADWAKDGAMLSAANAAIGVDAMALIRGEIKITNIEAQSPTIRLEQRRDGRASWQFSDGGGEAAIETAPTAPARSPRPLTIQRLNITDATLIYDAEGSDLVRFDGVDLSLDWPERAGDAVIKAALRPAADRVSIEATINRFDQFLNGDIRPLRARVDTKGGGVSLTGRAGLAGAVAGDLWLKTSDTGRFLAALGVGDIALPQGLGKTSDINLDLTLTPDRRLALREVVADLGGNALTGAADITLNGTPDVNAQINVGALDLTGFAGSAPSGTAPASSTPAPASPTGWSKAPIDASALSAFNGEIALRADSIDLGTLSLGATRVLLRNDRSRLVAELREIRAYAGVISGEFVVNNRNGLSVGGALNATSIAMQPLLQQTAGLGRFHGTGDAEVSFLGSGASLDAIMRSLSGSGAVNVGRGHIEGIDLDALMGNFDVEGGTTVFDSLAATFDMDQGVLRNDDLLMQLPNFTATGTGQVGLGAQTLDYTVTPKALRVNGDRGLAIPVRIFGPWAAPQIKPDLQAALDMNFAKEKEQARQKLNEKLEEELGVSRQDGQSVEDAVKQKVEDELRRGLFKLFD
ncbi:AsmA family protein [Sulfitobacter pontiacus]|uniref:AsmA family protein n=1 Tax=Sulfitobacter pontiacus TaxID=60137 RepID=UPI0021A86977|nr:AsmA family protein [Sulfitobacter pontiacus]UWR19649.1 AsmA family protein [Sulfitobacter pontiacus]